jgi:glycopeptide antibiotics resistance protein
MAKFFSTSVSFQRIADGLVWGASCAALIFGFYKLRTYNDNFVFWSTVAYVIGLFCILPWFRSDNMLRRYGYKRLASTIELLLLASLIVNGYGTLGWYRTTVHYDDFVHFITPAMITWGAGIWYVSHVALKRQLTKLPRKAYWVIGIGLACGLLWEPLELLFDYLFATTTSGQAGQELDTLYDVIMDVLGVCAGWAVFLLTRVRMLKWIQRGE